MAIVEFYEKPGCVNNARQKRLLLASGHELVVYDLLHTAWQAADLRAFFGQRPIAQWFNPASPRVRSGEIDPQAQTESSALALMLQDPLLIRRPLVRVGMRREAGFDREIIAAWIGLTPQFQATPDNLDLCQKAQACHDTTYTDGSDMPSVSTQQGM